MRKRHALIFLLFILILSSCVLFKGSGPPEQKVLIRTNYGEIVVKLYNATPRHRDNFIRLVDSQYYDSLLFHRVIDEFMIQGGDPESKNADNNTKLGNGGPGYTIPAEIVEGLYHKRGALAAAREPDEVNPEKASSGSQFYIVEGSVYKKDMLDLMETRKNAPIINEYINRYLKKPGNKQLKAKLDSSHRNNDKEKFRSLYLEAKEAVMPQIHADSVDLFDLNAEQREIYTTVGGAPHLDGDYTIFGELVYGMEVVEKISDVRTNLHDKPITDVRILEMMLLSEKEWKEYRKAHKKDCKIH